MDLFPLLAVPSILFTLLQYTSKIHDSEVKSIQKKIKTIQKKIKNMQEYLKKSGLEENIDFSGLEEDIDFIRAVQPKGVWKMLIIGFTVYLAFFAIFYIQDVLVVLGSKNSQGIDYMINPSSWWPSLISWLSSLPPPWLASLTPWLASLTFLLILYMLVLAIATCFQILSILKEKRNLDKSYKVVKEYRDNYLSYTKDILDDLQ